MTARCSNNGSSSRQSAFENSLSNEQESINAIVSLRERVRSLMIFLDQETRSIMGNLLSMKANEQASRGVIENPAVREEFSQRIVLYRIARLKTEQFIEGIKNAPPFSFIPALTLDMSSFATQAKTMKVLERDMYAVKAEYMDVNVDIDRFNRTAYNIVKKEAIDLFPVDSQATWDELLMEVDQCVDRVVDLSRVIVNYQPRNRNLEGGELAIINQFDKSWQQFTNLCIKMVEEMRNSGFQQIDRKAMKEIFNQRSKGIAFITNYNNKNGPEVPYVRVEKPISDANKNETVTLGEIDLKEKNFKVYAKNGTLTGIYKSAGKTKDQRNRIDLGSSHYFKDLIENWCKKNSGLLYSQALPHIFGEEGAYAVYEVSYFVGGDVYALFENDVFNATEERLVDEKELKLFCINVKMTKSFKIASKEVSENRISFMKSKAMHTEYSKLNRVFVEDMLEQISRIDRLFDPLIKKFEEIHYVE